MIQKGIKYIVYEWDGTHYTVVITKVRFDHLVIQYPDGLQQQIPKETFTYCLNAQAVC